MSEPTDFTFEIEFALPSDVRTIFVRVRGESFTAAERASHQRLREVLATLQGPPDAASFYQMRRCTLVTPEAFPK